MITGVSCWPRSRHSVNKIWTFLALLPSSFLCFLHPVKIFHCQVFVGACFYATLHPTPPHPTHPRPPILNSLQLHFNQNEGGDGHCFTYFILFKRAALRVVICGALSFLNQHKSSFIIWVTSCSLNALKYSFKYLLSWQECRDAPLLHQWHASQSICTISVLLLYEKLLSFQQFFHCSLTDSQARSQHFSHTKKQNY